MPSSSDLSSATAATSSNVVADEANISVSNNPLKVLKLLDTYVSYHDVGSDAMRKAFWNVTKARYRSNGGMGSALAMPSSSVSHASSWTDESGGVDSISSSGTAIFSILNPRNDLQARSVVAVSNVGNEGNKDDAAVSSSTSAGPVYKLFDPVIQRQQIQQRQEEEEKENNVIGELVDESPMMDIVDDPTKSTGLRQRGGAAAKQKQMQQSQNNTSMSKKTKGTTAPMRVEERTEQQQHSASSTAKTSAVDPFDDSMVTVMSLCGHNANHKNEMKLAQQNALQSLRNYIHAATIVAAIQNEINNNSNAAAKVQVTESAIPVATESEASNKTK